ncbi:MAG: 50S ribosome-binding GTPase [Candidatus Korarchaeota archaeon]|nr:50S ribosome-binding GTPase [Candidatus Korarchaeota archaeon]
MKVASWKEIAKAMDRVNVVLEVVDSRDPWTTRSRKLEEMAKRRGRKILVAINKSDLVPREILDQWVGIFEEDGLKATYLSARERLGTMRLRRFIKREAPELPAKVLIAGFPKVGKSSIINVLKGRSSASTSPVPGNPGYTRHFQLYRIDRNLYILDSPGILPVEGGPLEMAIRGYPPEELKNPVEVAVSLLERALRSNPGIVKRIYGIEGTDPIEILERLAEKRGWRFKDGEPNVEEAARQVIRDYHRYKLIFYVTPKDLGLI